MNRRVTCELQWCAGGLLCQKSLQPRYQVQVWLLSPGRSPCRCLHLPYHLLTRTQPPSTAAFFELLLGRCFKEAQRANARRFQ